MWCVRYLLNAFSDVNAQDVSEGERERGRENGGGSEGGIKERRGEGEIEREEREEREIGGYISFI